MLNRATAIGAILVALSTALTAAEPLAVLECREITGRDWGRTLVTYHLEGPGFKAASVSDGKAGEALPPEGSPGRVRLKAAVKPGEVRLLDASAKEVPFQLSRVRLTQDGAIVSARLSFYAELPASGSYHYELLPGRPAPSVAAPKMAVAGNLLVLDNGLVAIRLPHGKRQFQQPLAVAADHGQAMTHIDDLEKAGRLGPG